MTNERSMLINWVFAYFLAFGALTLIGGIIGYVKARSVASLVAGGVAGLLLILGAFLAFSSLGMIGLIILLLVSLALLGRFGPALLRGKLNPGVYIAPMALLGAVIAGYLLYVSAMMRAGA